MRPRALSALLLLCLAPAATAGETETTYGVGLVAGFDTNPLLVADDGPNGAFAQLRLDGGVTRYLGARSSTALFVDGHFAARTDASSTADAGRESGRLSAGVVWSPGFAGYRLLVSTGGRLSGYRGTFTDRATGLVYQANVEPPTDPPTTTAIPDRLDRDGTGAFLNLRWKQGRRVAWSLETAWDRADYVEDYRTSTGLDPLDHRALTLKPGVSVGFGSLASVTFHVAFVDLDYDDRLALDRLGAEVPGTRRSYRYTRYGLAAQVKPAEPWKLSAGVGAGGKDDTYAGYYDNHSLSGFVALERRFGGKSRVHVHASLREVDHDHATVTGDPVDELRATEEWRYVGRFHRDLGERFGWYLEGGSERTDSRDPVFAYDRDWVLTGIRFGR